MKKIILIGAGGHAKVVIDTLEKEGKYQVVALVDDEKSNSSWFDIPVYSWEKIPTLVVKAGIIAIGDNWVRHQMVEKTLQVFPDFEFVSSIHPSSQIARGVKIGKGSVIFPNTVVGPDARIGNHVLVNTGATIDHDCQIADFVSLAPGVTLGGKVKVASHTAISLGAKVIHSIEIGQHTVVGAGAIVIQDLPSSSICYGVPAKKMADRIPGQTYL